MNYHVYLGPYAEWLLQPKEYEPVFTLEPFFGHDPIWLTIEGKLTAAWSSGLPPEIQMRGKPYRRFPFLPCERPPVQTLKELRRRQCHVSHGELLGVADLRDLSRRGPEAEIRWLAKVYARELAGLEEYIGRRGTLHWGIVAWETD
jgi:hypothetical protein